MVVNNDTALRNLKSRYEFTSAETLSLEEILQCVWDDLVSSGFTEKSLKKERTIFNRLLKHAKDLGVTTYTQELRTSFLNDCNYHRSNCFSKTRYELHRLMIHRIDSFLKNGKVDYSPIRKYTSFMKNNVSDFIEAYSVYETSIGYLSKSTKDLYLGIVGHFLDYLAFDKQYTSLEDIKNGDVGAFIPKIVHEHYPNSLSSVISGLRHFLAYDAFKIDQYSLELPDHLSKKKRILAPLSCEEITQICNRLDNGIDISLRNKAIAEIAIGTGYRSVDIFGMTFSSFDWENERMSIVQKKNGKCLNYPMTASIGNAVIDYLLHERPDSESEYIFLSTASPHNPLQSHSACRLILKEVFEKCDIIIGERPLGTRLTRHSRATYLLNRGIPLSMIAQSLGHSDNNSVQIYLTADNEHMSECVLPLPGKRDVYDER